MLDGELGVMLYVSDLRRSAEFFRDKLGFGFQGYWDDATREVFENWDDVDDRVTSNGVDATEPQDFPWGARMFTVTDPDGHEYDFLEPLEQ